MDHLYSERMEPAMRKYLKTLRRAELCGIKPGYQEIAGGGNSEIPGSQRSTPEASKSKKGPQEISLVRKRSRPPANEDVVRHRSPTDEQSITTFFLVHEKRTPQHSRGPRLSSSRAGRPQRHHRKRAWWDQFEARRERHKPRRLRQSAGRAIEVYRNRPQLAVQQLRLAKPEEIDLADYLPHTAADVEKMFVELRGYAESISNPWLKQLVLGIIADPEVARCYKTRPRRQSHAPRLSRRPTRTRHLFCGMARRVATHYPELDIDLLLTACILHDVGKLEELCYERAIGYTTPGQLLGHIVMELETVTRAIDKIEGFPAPLKTVVQHLLISHHGQY